MEGAAREIKPSLSSKGLAVIITNDYDQATPSDSDEAAQKYDPLSTKNDGNRLREAFKALNYDVCWEHNVKAHDVQRIWNEIKSLKYEEVKHYRCIVFIFSGHGEQSEGETSAGGKLVMQDHSKIRISEEFIAPVLPGEAPSIGKIPKVFIIDACRGGKKTEIVQVPRKSPTSNSKGKEGTSPNPVEATADVEEPHMRKGSNEILFPIPKAGNFLVSFSTLPGCVANDIRGDGSAWLKLLAEEIPVSDESIDNVLTGLNKRLHAYYRQRNCDLQQPQKVSTLNDVLYLRHDNNQSHADGRRQILSSEPMEIDTPSSVQPPADQPVPQDGTSVDPVIPPPVQATLVQDTPTRPSSNGVVSRSKGSGKYCACLKEHTRPQFSYVTDRSSGSTRHCCTISYYKDGTKRYKDSGYYTTRISAEEQAAKKILTQENWLA